MASTAVSIERSRNVTRTCSGGDRRGTSSGRAFTTAVACCTAQTATASRVNVASRCCSLRVFALCRAPAGGRTCQAVSPGWGPIAGLGAQRRDVSKPDWIDDDVRKLRLAQNAAEFLLALRSPMPQRRR